LLYEERPMFPHDVLQATECFVTSATREVMPVVAVILAGGQRKEFPAGGGNATRSLQNEYSKYVRSYIEARRAEAWF
jgi:branched-subunit amino acid aminotransferase/4-amino-4-deoxychorismate lyase